MLRKRLEVLLSQTAVAAMSLILVLGLTTFTASAQSYSVVYNFTGGQDGALP